MRVVVGVSGASGVIYGIRLLEFLRQQAGVETHLILSSYGRLNITVETDYSVQAVENLADTVHSDKNLAAVVASGSFKTDAMVIAPCSMKTLSGIVNSYADNLIARAADVALKDRRRLILIPRETPLHLGHARLMVAAAEMGATLVPPMPAFYNRPQSVDDIVNHTVGRVLDLLGFDAEFLKRWAGIGAERSD